MWEEMSGEVGMRNVVWPEETGGSLGRAMVMAVFVTLAIFLTGCSYDLRQSPGDEARPVSDDLYYASQSEADESLARFDREHPQCQLWTNWQKMCSRTGGGSTTHCSIDTAHPVAPSRPFCARPGVGDMPDYEARSHNRFCADAAGTSGSTETKRCRFHQHDRPFNGYRLAALRSPVCRRWVDAGTRATICTEGVSGPRSCEVVADYPGNRPLACGQLVARPPCQLHPAGIVQYIESETMTSDLMLMPAMVAVNGLSCLMGISDAQ